MTRGPAIDARASTGALWLTCALALAILPRELFPWTWVAAFVVPAVLLHVLREHADLSLARAVPIAGLVHAGTVWAAHAVAGPIESETALGCSLLPPLAFLAARRRAEDCVWALFLALCTVLISTILGTPKAWMVWTFLAAGYATLQLETIARASRRRRAWRGAVGPRRLAFGGLWLCMIATLALSFGSLQLLAAIPTPNRTVVRSEPGSDPARRAVGLSDRFEFGGSGEGFLDLRSDQLVRVHVAGEPLGDELYLRTAHFELAGLTRWSKARPNERELMPASAVRHHGEPVVGHPEHAIAVEVLGTTNRFLFLPPGTLELTGLVRVVGNARQETFMRTSPAPVAYRVRFQDRRAAAAEQPFDRTWANLARLPREFDDHLLPFHALLREAGGTRDVAPAVLASRLASVLRREFRYELREPRGPFDGQSILNFVTGDRTGFCMHFASTLAICMRLAGVPCRVAVGLHASGLSLAPAAELVLGSQHAHAWVEIPLEGLGWVGFDPTPPANADVGGAPRDEPDRAGAAVAAITDWLDSRAIWILIALGGLGVWLAAGRPLDRGEQAAARARVDPDLASQFRALLRSLARSVPRLPGQSLHEYAQALARDERLPHDAVRAAFVAYEEVRFGRRQLDAERGERIREATRLTRRLGLVRQ